jgi:putative ABC transport system permease protein
LGGGFYDFFTLPYFWFDVGRLPCVADVKTISCRCFATIKKQIKAMFQHLFKLLWKKRKSNFLIMLEIFVAFIIVFAVASAGVFAYRNYVKPSGINTDNVWTVYVNYNSLNDSLNHINGELLEQKIKSFKEIQAYSFGAETFPYGNSQSNRGFNAKGETVMSSVVFIDEHAPSVLGLELSAGSWFKNSDTLQKGQPVVISQHLSEKLFGTENPIGKSVGDVDISGNVVSSNQRIVGIIPYFKKFTDFETPTYTIIQPYTGVKTSFIARTTPSVSADFEARFAKSLRQLGKNWNIEILHMDDMKKDKNSMVIIPFIISFIVCGFLIINVAFGLFGVLFQNINRRRGEIGIRRAMGATEGDIMRQFVGEMGVLATFAIALGVFFAVQFPILKVFDVATSVYIWGILIAVAAVYGLVLLCSWFPSRQAAAIYPAMALHED